MEEIANNIEDINEVEKDIRMDLNIQKFMDDMEMVGVQVNNKNLVKPGFHYGDLSVTNYLLWLLLGEMMMLNDKLNDEVED